MLSATKRVPSPSFLLVTFPVDFGNLTLARNLNRMLSGNSSVQEHSFSPREDISRGEPMPYIQRIISRARSIADVRRECARAVSREDVVLFQGISPAVFASPIKRGSLSFILLDWTRSIHGDVDRRLGGHALADTIHSRVLRSFDGVIAFTDAARHSVVADYGVDSAKAWTMPMPFDVSAIAQSVPNEDRPLRLLFVGADFYAKGGGKLMDWYRRADRSKIRLTVVTQTQVELPSDVTLLRTHPTNGLFDEYANHDVFVLPTLRDAYPQVVGEAASGGLAVVVSNRALGATEVVDHGKNGFIFDSDVEMAEALNVLISDRGTVERFKQASRRKMERGFTYDHAYQRLLEIVESTRAGKHGGPHTS